MGIHCCHSKVSFLNILTSNNAALNELIHVRYIGLNCRAIRIAFGITSLFVSLGITIYGLVNLFASMLLFVGVKKVNEIIQPSLTVKVNFYSMETKYKF